MQARPAHAARHLTPRAIACRLIITYPPNAAPTTRTLPPQGKPATAWQRLSAHTGLAPGATKFN